MSKTKGGRSPEAIARHAQRQAEWEASEPARIAASEKERRNKMSPSQQKREKKAAERMNAIASALSPSALLEDGLQKGLELSRSKPLVEREYEPLNYHDPNCIVVAPDPMGAFECGGSNCKRSPVDSGMDER